MQCRLLAGFLTCRVGNVVLADARRLHADLSTYEKVSSHASQQIDCGSRSFADTTGDPAARWLLNFSSQIRRVASCVVESTRFLHAS